MAENGTFRVLVSDSFSETGLEVFRRAPGIEVDYKPGLKPEEQKAIIGQYHGLAVRSATKVNEDLLSAATNLRVVGRAGTGVDNVDLVGATKRGICVMNTPGGNTVTTAEHAVSMMMSLARKIPAATASLKGGKWEKNKFQGTEMFNKVLGVIGLGQIGRVVADRAVGLKMRVIAYDPFVTAEHARDLHVDKVELDDLFARADFITIHVPKSRETENLVRAETIAKMKKGVRIINCARGGIVNEKDLHDALVSGHVAGAALDVFAAEPCTDSPLFGLDNVVVTPHLGASTDEAQENVAVAIAEQMIDYLTRGVVTNSVNVPSVSQEVLKELGPYLTLAEKIGRLHGQLTVGRVTPKGLEIIYGGELTRFAAEPLKTLKIAILKGLLSCWHDTEVNFVNAEHVAKTVHGIEPRESRSPAVEDYHQYLTVVLTYPTGESRSLTGTIFGLNDIRLVKYDQKVLNIELEGHMLVMRNNDVPGVVGWVGTVLGDAKINIGNMRLGRSVADRTALTIVTTDEPVPDEVIAALKKNPAITSAKRASL
ncbi:MAG: phosphoglycerate dehydrogenase [Deltaproteobacteria bacterium]|nr:phosphoglycerate dehydrogenase [Deltaproteobacteria bacterium]